MGGLCNCFCSDRTAVCIMSLPIADAPDSSDLFHASLRYVSAIGSQLHYCVGCQGGGTWTWKLVNIYSNPRAIQSFRSRNNYPVHMVRLRHGHQAELDPDRSYPAAAGYVIVFKVGVSYTVETARDGRYRLFCLSVPTQKGVMFASATMLPGCEIHIRIGSEDANWPACYNGELSPTSRRGTTFPPKSIRKLA